MGDKEITIQFADGRKAKIVKIEDLDTKKFIDELSAKIMKLEKELANSFTKKELLEKADELEKFREDIRVVDVKLFIRRNLLGE